MDIVQPNPHGILTDDSLIVFENKIDVRLPEDYRLYLKKYNGGLPEKACFYIQKKQIESRIHHMYGLNDGPTYQKLDCVMKIYKGRIPNGVLPIADDPFGNIICIGIEKKCFGNILFWDHEKESLYDQALDQISPTFTLFVSGLFDKEYISDDIVAAIKNNNIKFLMKLIDSGYDIEMKDEYGRTLLENAAIFNKPEIIKYLYDKGAKLNKSLYYAIENLEFFPDHQVTVDLIKILMKRNQQHA